MAEKLATFRLPLEVDKELGKLAQVKGTDKSKVMRELLILGIKEKKIEESFKLYIKGKVTLWKASKLAGLSLWEMMEIVRERKIPAQYGVKELKEDIKALR